VAKIEVERLHRQNHSGRKTDLGNPFLAKAFLPELHCAVITDGRFIAVQLEKKEAVSVFALGGVGTR
jgi:hypothetical protein